MDPSNKRIWARLCAFVGCMLVVAWLNTSAAAQTVDGSSSGVFINAVGEANLVTTGLGTSDFTWGEGFQGSPPSSLSFTGTPFSTEVEQPFVVGMLDYFNGTTVGGTQADSVDLEMTLNFTSPTGVDEVLVFPFELINRTNIEDDPIASADFVFLSRQTAGSFFNLGNRSFTLAIAFANATEGGFENVDEFFVLEGETASAQLIGVITSALIPEPSTFILAILGLLSLGFRARRRRKRT